MVIAPMIVTMAGATATTMPINSVMAIVTTAVATIADPLRRPRSPPRTPSGLRAGLPPSLIALASLHPGSA